MANSVTAVQGISALAHATEVQSAAKAQPKASALPQDIVTLSNAAKPPATAAKPAATNTGKNQ